MSCAVCEGRPRCPVCGPEPRMMTCPECGGAGYTYYDGEGNEITKAAYNQLPAKCREKVPCDLCEGAGEIEDDNEPDYDHYDD